MLPEMIGTEEFFALIAFTKLVNSGKMVDPGVPVRCGVVWKFQSAIPANICLARKTTRRLWGSVGIRIRRDGCAVVEGSHVATG